MTTKIMEWMIGGLIVGSLINTFAHDISFIQRYLVDGIFHVVGDVFINVC